MAIDWAKVDAAVDLAQRANTIKANIAAGDLAGKVALFGNPDLEVTFANPSPMRNFCVNQMQSLFDQARTMLAGAA